MGDADTPIPELLAEVKRLEEALTDAANVEMTLRMEITRLRERLERAQWLARDGDARG